MAREGLFALLCAGIVSMAGPLAWTHAEPAEDRDGHIAITLAVQTSLQQGREHLLRGSAEAAVKVLEGQLPRINGNREYLMVMRDAYRAYIKELKLAGREAEAQQYLQFLRILEPAATVEGNTTRAANSPTPSVIPGPPARPSADQAKPVAVARAKSLDDPFHEDNSAHRQARGLLERAEQEFSQQHYSAAGQLFEQAHRADPSATADCRERWGYCRLRRVGEQLNLSSGGGAACEDLEKEVNAALKLAPLTARLESFGTTLLHEIEERRAGNTAAARTEAVPTVRIRHQERQAEGWAVAETDNFILYHNQPRDLVERAAQAAEQTRATMQRKWFGEASEQWNPKCELYLHATGSDYSKATGVPGNSPGHSTIRSDNTRVVTRRIDLHCDDPNLVVAVLPHETTHVVLAGRFGEQPVPRWADEGMAVLTEPREKVERHLRNLPQYRQDRQLFGLHQLLNMNDYPDPRYIGSFYAQSVSVVEFLTQEKGPQAFTQFLRDGLKSGYEAALKRYYGFQDFHELEQRWVKFAFRENANPVGVADRGGR